MQVDEADRGFSFMRDGPLDMRMNPSAAVTAEQIVNDWSEDRLGKIIRDYGEERYWKSIARRIAEARTVSRIRTTGELVDLVGGPRPGRRKGGAPRGIHPATRTFQALRIAVNDELGVLERGIPRAIECLAPGGRLAVISFHSLEDRIVKRAFLAAAGRPYVEEEDEVAYSTSNIFLEKETPKPLVKILTRKPFVPSEEEARKNSRSRSAKLRVVEKL
ncbi:hypothetical protein KFL_000890210 [Klebsormidium nitens]|uniref:S-adenosyl-methyltransferase n=1 Tax=Klebsormidium nitens TaxID=105231 RepID=A0A1Y1HVA3_KLENI|nr:hypothetical protein KFL_000890210 [Klebsormidium nitens]|eukprot:GAQ81732.1 hypothetical protein KFL_000890210 [Klebsormidium nitens]